MRYQVIFSKNGFPATQWLNSKEKAEQVASRLQSVGYSVDIWEHTKEMARLVASSHK